jgi:hypothetical protein
MDAPKEVEQFDFGFSKIPINQTKHPLLSKRIDESDAGNALLWELPSLPTLMNRNAKFDFLHNTKGCLINVPMHTTEKGMLATAGRKGNKWLEAILEQVNNNPEEGAQWICIYLGNTYEDAF